MRVLEALHTSLYHSGSRVRGSSDNENLKGHGWGVVGHGDGGWMDGWVDGWFQALITTVDTINRKEY